jgi:hypothetical protein
MCNILDWPGPGPLHDLPISTLLTYRNSQNRESNGGLRGSALRPGPPHAGGFDSDISRGMAKTNHATVFASVSRGVGRERLTRKLGAMPGSFAAGNGPSLVCKVCFGPVVSTIRLGMGSLMGTKVQFCCW